MVLRFAALVNLSREYPADTGNRGRPPSFAQ